MTVMNFDLEDGHPPVSFTLKPVDAERFITFMAECHKALTRTTRADAQPEEWINVKECPPEIGSNVFAFWPPRNGYPVHGGCFGTATYAGGHWHNVEDDEDDYAEPSHWMRLPAPPASEQ